MFIRENRDYTVIFASRVVSFRIAVVGIPLGVRFGFSRGDFFAIVGVKQGGSEEQEGDGDKWSQIGEKASDSGIAGFLSEIRGEMFQQVITGDGQQHAKPPGDSSNRRRFF